MKYLKIFEDFDRGGSYPIPQKQIKYIMDNYPCIIDIKCTDCIKTDGTYYYKGEKIYETLDEAILGLFNSFGIKKYTINNDLLDVNQSVFLSNRNLDKLPFRFGEVTHSFTCYDNRLTTLEGAPHTVGNDFTCYNNKLTTLEGAPHTVGKNFKCHSNQLITLEGAPHTVGGDFWCYFNQLATLEGSPHDVGGDFRCESNKLITLKGAPHNVGGYFDIKFNQLENLKYLPKEIGGDIYYRGNQDLLIDFNDVPKEWKSKLNKII